MQSVACRRVHDRVRDVSTAVRADVPGRSALVVGGATDHDRRRTAAGQRIVWLSSCGTSCSADCRARQASCRRRAGVAVATVVSRPVVRVVVRVVLPVLAPLVGILLPVLTGLVALPLALLQVLLPLVLQGLSLLGSSKPRTALVLPLRRRVAIVLCGTSTGPVVARRPLTAERAARGWSAIAVSAPAPALPEGAASRGSAARESAATWGTASSAREPPAAAPAPAASATPAAARRRSGDGDEHQGRHEPRDRGSPGAAHGWFWGRRTRKGISCAPSAGVKVNVLSGTSGVKFQPLKFAVYCG